MLASLERARSTDEYAAAHGAALEDGLSICVHECMMAQPRDPLQFIGMHLLRGSSQAVAGSATGDTTRQSRVSKGGAGLTAARCTR